MFMKRCIALLALTLVPASVWAQDTLHNWSALNPSGLSTVYVLDDTGQETTGKFLCVDADSLVVLIDGREQRFRPHESSAAIQRGQGLGLALKPRDPLRVGGERRGQDLDGDVAIEPRVPRPIHFAHAAGSEGRDDLVRAEAGTGSEGQTLAVDYTGGTAARP